MSLTNQQSYMAIYLGCAILDRRYPPQFVMPWVMAEVKRRKSSFHEVKLEVLPHVLHAADFDTGSLVFEHKLIYLSRFAKTHQDPRCFAYLNRHDLTSDFECHVFLAHDENMVPELFNCIREATQRDIFEEMGEAKSSEPAKAFYEVLYLGRAKSSNKKITCANIDDLCYKLAEKEKKRNLLSLDKKNNRHRNPSGTSVKSLPATLEEEVSVTENELEKQHKKIFSTEYTDSPTSSTDELASLSDQHSSSENILENSGNFSNKNIFSSSGGISNSNSEDSKEDLCSNNSNTKIENNDTDQEHAHKELHVHFNDSHSSDENIAIPNKTMLFRLGASEISLISLDKKSCILERKFKDISSVSQGKEKADVFGFIAREKGNVFICHLMKCHSFTIVDEIMAVLKMSFQSAYEQNRQQICIMCPLHQLHRLCQEINGLSPQEAYELILRRLHNLPEKDAQEVLAVVKAENPQSYEETVEVMMIGLRKLCENKQKDHTHISDHNKNVLKTEFNIMESKAAKASSAFDSLKNKCKKSLATSFETLLSRGRKKDEHKEAFRQRSGTTDSESSWTKSYDSSTTSTPEASPLPSPAFPIKDTTFHFPSPPSSPQTGRPRSSTVGAMPDPKLASRYIDTGHLDKSQLQVDFKEHSARRASTNSPMKQMFLLAGSGSGKRDHHNSNKSPSSNEGTPNYTPGRRGSWRQAIFNRVVTPVRTPTTQTVPEKNESEVGPAQRHLTQQEIRSLWKKAILQTLLLIRMEKEKQDIKARQHEAQQKPSLDYEEITPCLKDVTKTWEEMLSSEDRHTTKFSPKTLLDSVHQGVPKQRRGDIWWLLVEQHHLHYPDMHERTPSKDYCELLKDLTEYQHNILIDLGRTFPGHPYFSTQLGPGQLALYNILKAYSLLDKDVGYCQGLSFIAGVLLMHMEETRSFEAMRHMMFNFGLRKQFQPNMMPLQIQLYQLTRLIHDNYKDLHDHFEEYDIAPNLYATPWFLTLFASQFPLGFVARVFDLFFMQGVEVLLKVGLVLLGNHKELILQCRSFEETLEFIKTTLPEMGIIQMERVINQVFEMDISKQLQAYEVEYHVLREEMLYSPSRGDADVINKLEDANQNLKHQNVELLEKLQHLHSHQRSLEMTIHNLQTNESKLKSHIKTLEIERKALLNAVTKLRHMIPEEEFEKLDILLPPLAPSLPSSPIHQPPSSQTRTSSNKANLKPQSHLTVTKVRSCPLVGQFDEETTN